MKKRRGEVPKRLCRSSYYCGSRNSDRENQMKTEEHLEPIAVFIQRVTAAVSELKDDLQQKITSGHIHAWAKSSALSSTKRKPKRGSYHFSRTCSCPTWWKRTSPILNLQPVEAKHEDVFERLHRKANGFHHERIRLRKTAVQT